MTHGAPRIVTAVARSADPGILEAVTRRDTALAVWERGQDPALTAWLGTLTEKGLPRCRQVIKPQDAGQAMADHLAKVVPSPSPHRDALASLVDHLAEVVARITPCPAVRLRLDAPQQQSCPRWHLDAVTARLICTLKGPGTEFGPVGSGGAPKIVSQMPTGAVAIFRGSLWPGDDLSGILHRSPGLAPGDPARVVLVLDPITDAGDWD